MTTRTIQFKIYRYDPDRDDKPYMQDIASRSIPPTASCSTPWCKLKAKDDSLSFRRSCREGVCGSDAMNINGKNGLACLTDLKDLPASRRAAPAARPAHHPRPDRGHDAVLQAVPLDQALPHQQRPAAGDASGCSRPRSARS
jgi:hypothetical protein